MEKIISPKTESIHEAERDLSIENIFFEMLKDEAYAMERGLTKVGYDDEIGLWEELESRFRRRVQISRASH